MDILSGIAVPLLPVQTSCILFLVCFLIAKLEPYLLIMEDLALASQTISVFSLVLDYLKHSNTSLNRCISAITTSITITDPVFYTLVHFLQ